LLLTDKNTRRNDAACIAHSCRHIWRRQQDETRALRWPEKDVTSVVVSNGICPKVFQLMKYKTTKRQ